MKSYHENNNIYIDNFYYVNKNFMDYIGWSLLDYSTNKNFKNIDIDKSLENLKILKTFTSLREIKQWYDTFNDNWYHYSFIHTCN
jgi:glutaredoxin-related protein